MWCVCDMFCVYASACVHVCMYLCALYVCMCACMCVCVLCVSMCACMCCGFVLYVYACVHVCVSICVAVFLIACKYYDAQCPMQSRLLAIWVAMYICLKLATVMSSSMFGDNQDTTV